MRKSVLDTKKAELQLEFIQDSLQEAESLLQTIANHFNYDVTNVVAMLRQSRADTISLRSAVAGYGVSNANIQPVEEKRG